MPTARAFSSGRYLFDVFPDRNSNLPKVWSLPICRGDSIDRVNRALRRDQQSALGIDTEVQGLQREDRFMVTWADLVEAERDVIMLASEVAPVWEVCAKLGRLDGSTRSPIEPTAGQATVGRLVDLGLVASYALGEPDSDLSDVEVAELFDSSGAWSGEAALQVGVLLYLTPLGQGLCCDGSGT